MGTALGAVIGLVTAFVLAKVEFYTNFRLGLLNSLVGYAVGYGVLLGSKRGGVLPAIIGGVLAFFAMMLSEYLYFGDVVAKVAAEHNDPSLQMSTPLFLGHLTHMTSGWLFILIGIYGGAKTPLRAPR